MKVVAAVFWVPSWQFPASEVARLRAAFPHIAFAHATIAGELSAEIRDAEVAVLTRLSPEDFGSAASLRWVHSAAAGVGGLLFPEMRRSEVVLTNSRGVHGPSMAEHVIGVSIALLRDLPGAVRRQAARQWAHPDVSSVKTLRGRELLVVGLGSVGIEVARLAHALGMRVSAVRRHTERPRPPFVDEVRGPGELGVLLARADIVVLATPLTTETRSVVGRPELRQMKRSAILVNIARGKLVNERELAEELAAGTIAAAALDVVEHEPLDAASPLWGLPNVLITPHTSGFREDYWPAVVDLFMENLRRYESGRPLLNLVDKEAGY